LIGLWIFAHDSTRGEIPIIRLINNLGTCQAGHELRMKEIWIYHVDTCTKAFIEMSGLAYNVDAEIILLRKRLIT
jgi:hypothetical protein